MDNLGDKVKILSYASVPERITFICIIISIKAKGKY